MNHFVLRFAQLVVFVVSFLIQGAVSLAETRMERADLEQVFKDNQTSGTFVLYDLSKDHLTVVNPERAAERKYPASTFKIANSLIALETGAVENEEEIIPYGGKPQPLKIWEKDMSMRDAIKISNVPVYQHLARRIGIEKYHKWLAILDYGNRLTGGDLNTFWLKGPLTISAIEQVEFLGNLAQGKLPLSSRSQSIVIDIVKLDEREGRVLSGKSGWSSAASPQIGWFVGWVTNEQGIFAFAMNMDINSRADVKKRKSITLDLLGRLGVF